MKRKRTYTARRLDALRRDLVELSEKTSFLDTKIFMEEEEEGIWNTAQVISSFTFSVKNSGKMSSGSSLVSPLQPVRVNKKRGAMIYEDVMIRMGFSLTSFELIKNQYHSLLLAAFQIENESENKTDTLKLNETFFIHNIRTKNTPPVAPQKMKSKKSKGTRKTSIENTQSKFHYIEGIGLLCLLTYLAQDSLRKTTEKKTDGLFEELVRDGGLKALINVSGLNDKLNESGSLTRVQELFHRYRHQIELLDLCDFIEYFQCIDMPKNVVSMTSCCHVSGGDDRLKMNPETTAIKESGIPKETKNLLSCYHTQNWHSHRLSAVTQRYVATEEKSCVISSLNWVDGFWKFKLRRNTTMKPTISSRFIVDDKTDEHHISSPLENELCKIIQTALDTKEFLSHASRGIILHGAPGCGKTQTVLNVSRRLGLPRRIVKAVDVMSKFMGEDMQKIEQLFAECKEVQPVLLIWDEGDAIFNNRSFDRNHDSARIVSTLLNFLSSDDNTCGIFHVIITNLKEKLDPATLSRCSHIFDVTSKESVQCTLINVLARMKCKMDMSEPKLKLLLSAIELSSEKIDLRCVVTSIEESVNELRSKNKTEKQGGTLEDVQEQPLLTLSEIEPIFIKKIYTKSLKKRSSNRERLDMMKNYLCQRGCPVVFCTEGLLEAFPRKISESTQLNLLDVVNRTANYKLSSYQLTTESVSLILDGSKDEPYVIRILVFPNELEKSTQTTWRDLMISKKDSLLLSLNLRVDSLFKRILPD
jgi:AAA+ superfamily predicted ATPase